MLKKGKREARSAAKEAVTLTSEQEREQKRHHRLKRTVRLLCDLFMVAGICAVMYPAFADVYNDYWQQKAIADYTLTADDLTTEEQDAEFQKALEYNGMLAGDAQYVKDPFLAGAGFIIPDNYGDVLNINGDGCMGTLRIPAIDLALPIYHGVDEDALQRGVGHMHQTMLPIGADEETGTCHTVLTAHRGLPSSELFTNLDKLQEGDEVYIQVLGRTIAYVVTSTETVEPQEVNKLRPEEGVDQLTLLTCTPYGINSHRLLVHCLRTDYDPENEQTAHFDVTKLDPRAYAFGLGTAFLCYLLWKRWHDKRRRPPEMAFRLSPEAAKEHEKTKEGAK